MPFYIVRNDITRMECDAIVNAANSSLLGGGGVDGAIHRAAGPNLLAECKLLGGCLCGEAKVTGGYLLPCKFVIHTVGPVWKGGTDGEEQKLRSCYRKSLELAKKMNCETIAFPLISSGVYGYPKQEALQVASEEIQGFLEQNDMTVYLVVFDRNAFQVSRSLRADVEEYIDQNYVDEHDNTYWRRLDSDMVQSVSLWGNRSESNPYPVPSAKKAEEDWCGANAFEASESASLDELIRRLDESFSQMLLRKIDESGMTDAQCYKKANIDRKLFSKIRSDVNYKPSKVTAIAFAIALELPFPESEDLLKKAGFALSHSNKFDVIIEFFLRRGMYDIHKINEVLFSFDQVLLGVG